MGRSGGLHRVLARVAAAAVLAGMGVGSGRPAAAIDTGDWLGWVNFYRSTAGLGTVSEDPRLSDGDAKHARYMVANNVICHCEDPSKPFYTPEGATAAQESDIQVNSNALTNRQAVENWMEAPFHAIGMIAPDLAKVGFGVYQDLSLSDGFRYGSGLNILAGVGTAPASTTYPIVWPGNGSNVPLTSYPGGESPDPLPSCPGYSVPTGLPILVELPPSASTAVTSFSVSDGGQPLPACEIDSTNYTNPSQQQLGRAVLGAHNGVVIIPRSPLTAGHSYSVSLTNQGATYQWSFAVGGMTAAGSNSGGPARPWTGGSDAVGLSQPATSFYFAEGYTGNGFQEYLTVENPGAAQALTVIYYLPSGSTSTRIYQLSAQSRTTIDVNADVGTGQQISAQLTAASPFVAERPMYFSFPGSITGGHDTVGATQLGQAFYFAEGYTGFNEYLTMLNPGTTVANVQVTYYFNGSPSRTVAHSVPPTSRQTVAVGDPAEAGPNRDVAMSVSSDQPIVAERPLYFNYRGDTGGSTVVGSTAPSKHLNLAEGHVGPGFDEYLTILNGNPAVANVTITYLRTGASPVTQQVTVAATSRSSVHVNDVLGAFADASVHIDSDQPLVVERPIYFTYPAAPGVAWDGGHDAMAVDDSALSTTFYFAEGYVAANFAEYYTFLNRNPVPASVTLTYLLANGQTVAKQLTVPAASRLTRNVASDLPAGTSNAAQITSDQPILVERPMYFSY